MLTIAWLPKCCWPLIEPCISKLLCPPKSCAAVPGGALNCPMFSSKGVLGCVPGCDCGIWSPYPPVSMFERLSRSKSSMLKMLERSPRLPSMVAIVSRFSDACDHIWSAGTFMLVLVLVSLGRDAQRASNRVERNAFEVLLLKLRMGRGREWPWYASRSVVTSFQLIRDRRSSSSRAGCRAQRLE